MAEQKLWLGSVGPLLYDDTDLISDDDGDLPGETYSALSTTGQLTIMTPPTENGNVLRREDVTAAAHLTYEEGTLSLTANGFATPVPVTGSYMVLGKFVSYIINGFTEVSNANTFNLGTLPTQLRPTVTIVTTMVGIDNGIAKIIVASVGVSGVIVFQSTAGSNASWSPIGNKGLFVTTINFIKM